MLLALLLHLICDQITQVKFAQLVLEYLVKDALEGRPAFLVRVLLIQAQYLRAIQLESIVTEQLAQLLHS